MTSITALPADVSRPVATARRWWFAALLPAAYYGILLAGVLVAVKTRPPLHDLTFNSMLDHLLHGRFDVDAAIIGDEGFTRAGHVYAYWGILPALLRLPIVAVPGWQGLNVTAASCLVALFLMIAVKMWTLRAVALARPDLPRWMVAAMIAVIGWSGAQACFVYPSVYQEVCLWAGLWGALFVAGAIAGQLNGYGRGELVAMASAAGAAMLTRVSVGIALLAAFGLLMLVRGWRQRHDARGFAAALALPVLILALAGLATAYVNFERWGNPLTFADYSLYNFNLRFPDRIARTAHYGLFNGQRIPFGLVYYFFPVWVLHGSDGALMLEAMRNRLVDSAELPPGSFLLTDPLLLVLGLAAIAGWWRRRDRAAAEGGAIALGLAVSPLLMLTAISMCFRYRMDFYPLFEFLAFSGLAMAGTTGLVRRPRLVWGLAVLAILASHAAGIAYALSDSGPGQRLIGDGIGHYYAHRLAHP